MSTLQVIQFVIFLFPYLEVTIRHWKGHVFTHHPKKVHPLGMVQKKPCIYVSGITNSPSPLVSEFPGFLVGSINRITPVATTEDPGTTWDRNGRRQWWEVLAEVGGNPGGPGRCWGDVASWDSGFATYKHVFLLVIKSDKKGLFFKREVIGSSMKHWVWF